jgi:hypothetical protein
MALTIQKGPVIHRPFIKFGDTTKNGIYKYSKWNHLKIAFFSACSKISKKKKKEFIYKPCHFLAFFFFWYLYIFFLTFF